VLDLSSPLVEERREETAGSLTVLLRAPSDLPPPDLREEHPIAWEGCGAMRAAVAVRSRREAGRLLVVCAIVTTWQGLGAAPDLDPGTALDRARAQAEAALDRGGQELRARHRARPLPGAEEVLLELTGSEEAEQLALAVARGRHLLAASSRPGLPPASFTTARDLEPHPSRAPTGGARASAAGDAGSVRASPWAAGVAHVPDAVAALEEITGMLRESGRETAHRLYGADGWALHHRTDPWGYTDPSRGDATGTPWPLGGLWLERELDSLARFSGQDPVQIARSRFPALKEAVAFALCLLRESADGHLVTFPSTSPGSSWRTADGAATPLSEGTGGDRWLLRETAEHLMRAACLLDRRGDPVVQQAASVLELVPGVRIGADGLVAPWHSECLRTAPDPAPDLSSDLSHLGFLYPGEQPVTPKEERAAAATLAAREDSDERSGEGTDGRSLVWAACLWARLRRGDRVQALLERLRSRRRRRGVPGAEPSRRDRAAARAAGPAGLRDGAGTARPARARAGHELARGPADGALGACPRPRGARRAPPAPGRPGVDARAAGPGAGAPGPRGPRGLTELPDRAS
jgi:alpha-L-fucosidase 2